MTITNLISIYLLCVTVVVVYFAVQIRTLGKANYTKAALLLCFAVCFYILGYVMELNSSTASQILFWNRIEYLGIPFVSALWLTTAVMYTDLFSRRKKLLYAAIYIIPFLTLLFRLTNHWHHLYFSSVRFEAGLGGLLIVKQPGPWMVVQVVHSASMIIIAMAIFIIEAVKKPGRQAGKIHFIVAASVFGITGLVLTQFKLLPLYIDYMVMFLPVTCLIVIFAITRYDLLETKFIARDLVFESIGDAVLLVNRENRIMDFNAAAVNFFEQLGIRLENGSLPAVLTEDYKDLIKALEQTETSVQKLKVGDRESYFEITTEAIIDRNATRGFIKTIRDITEIHRLTEELSRQAATDELSTLSNRRAFLSMSQDWISKAEEHGCIHLLMLDLDHFKNVNDRYGHLSGDQAIRDFSHILKSQFAEGTPVARLGGEEFAVLVENLSTDEVLKIADDLLAESEQHEYLYAGDRFHVTVSIGVTRRQPGQTLEQLMQNADKALYQSKELSGNCATAL